MPHTREYLEEIFQELKGLVPDSLYKRLMMAARNRAGGRAAHRVDLPSTIEKLALAEIRPGKLKDVDDDELRAVWLRLHQWYANAKRNREAVENIVNAALWVKAEIEGRGNAVSASPLVAAVAELEAVKKERAKSVKGERGPLPKFIERKLDRAPDEILLVRDFVSVAGSAAVAEKPGDIDVVVRALYDAPSASYLLGGASMWKALQRILTPNKAGPQIQMLGSPQGSFTDYIPMFDLVLRRREPHVEKIEQAPPDYEGKERVIKSLWGSSGGKKYLAGAIISCMPEHKTYVEPFAGGAAVYWRKEPSEREVLNDLDKDIAFSYRFVKGCSDDEIERLKKMNWTLSRDRWDRVKKMSPASDAERFYKVRYLNYGGFYGNSATSYNMAHTGMSSTIPDRLSKARERMKSTSVHSEDYAAVVRKYDSSETFFFFDPPYPGYQQKLGEENFDGERFAKILKGIKGKFLVTYGPKSDIEPFKSFNIRKITTMSGTPRGGQAEKETVLISNYPLPARIAKEEKIQKAYGHSVCMQCKKAAPELDVIWADGRGRAWFCKECFPKWREEVGDWGEVVSVKPILDGKATPKHSDNRNGRLRELEKARAASAEQRAQAERAKKSDALTLGEFFYQPKPTRPAFEEEPQSLDRLLELFEERREKWLPAWVQKKYDGARHQIHKDNNEVRIFSEDGDDNTDRLPGIVAAVKALPQHRLMLDTEIERWRDGQHLPREAVAAYLAGRDEPDDSELVANVFDVLNWKGQDVHNRQLRLRLEYLKQLGQVGTMGIPPAGKRLNISPGEEVKTVAELKRAVEKIRRLPGSEGIVAKQMDSTYPLELVTSDRWVKFHNSTTLRGVVTGATRTKGGAWVYEYAIAPGKEKAQHYVDGEKLVPVGLTFSTGRAFHRGDPILIEAESVNKVRTPSGITLSAWAPRVLGDYEGSPDTVDEVVKRAAEHLVLQVKEADDAGNVTEYYEPNVIKVRRQVALKTVGPDSAPVAFVGASPGPIDVIRQEPLVGADGATFREVYLEPFGLQRSQVILMHAVPELLYDDDGRPREPSKDEVAEWKEWLGAELDRKKPGIVLALGKTAEQALGKRADLTLPHPSAVRRFGDSGEVGRKMRRIQPRVREAMGLLKQTPKALTKALSEGGTRSARALEHWESSWWKLLPRSGKGRFVYQHHWRGLSEDEIGMTDAELMKTDHSVHGDLRLEGDDGLWGFTIFLGETRDNRGPSLDKLIDWKAGDNIEATPKLGQPEEWLEVGRGKPYVSPPGEVGATSEKYSKFFERDHGTFELGMVRQHMVEVKLDGEHLKGIYLMMLAPVAGQRRWLIDKPENQTPQAERRDLADVLSELKRKHQSHLVWGKPGEKPRFIEVSSGRVEKGGLVEIRKADEEKHIVYGVVLDPYGDSGPEADAHNDWNPPGEIEKTAHEYAKQSRVIGLQHQKKADARMVESWVEQYPSRADYLAALAGSPHRVYRRKFGDDVLHSGSWVMGVELGPEEWKLYQDGKLNAFSPGGVGARRSLTVSQMPKVTFVDIVEAKPRAT